jgi:predicted ferric reductase
LNTTKLNDRVLPKLPGLPGKALAGAYILVAILPILVMSMGEIAPASPLTEFGTALGLTATALLFLQFLSSGRYEGISGQVGLDRTMGFHRIAALVLLGFVILHPLFYVAETLFVDANAAWDRLWGMLSSNRLRTGLLALVGIFVVVGFATIRSISFIRYEFWRVTHGTLAIVVAALSLHHALSVGVYSAEYPLRLVWFVFAFAAAVAIFLVYVMRPWRMWREDWRVDRVTPLSAGVWELVLRGPDATRLRFKGGQFVWMTLSPHRPPFHDHPFSIASAATNLPWLRFVIQEAGDYTSGVGKIAPGTRVAIDGPHGSFVLPAGEGPVVMIAGGVGIAPFLGMLEEAAALGDRRPIRLVYAAHKTNGLASLKRLRELQAELDLEIYCVVEEETPNSDNLVGPLGNQHILQSLEGLQTEKLTALVCGPPGMMEIATDALLAAGISARSIHYERFDYAAGKGQLDRVRRTEALFPFLILVAVMIAFSLR